MFGGYQKWCESIFCSNQLSFFIAFPFHYFSVMKKTLPHLLLEADNFAFGFACGFFFVKGISRFCICFIIFVGSFFLKKHGPFQQ